ncbi:MAG TPA: threonine dehydratase, partial [Burkholderiaceae bacterium]|nr:threonine dehydratase [Burkholderiaceae bacterium]
MFDRESLTAALATVHAVQPPTPQYCWPLLSQRLGAQAWVKHENHTQVGAFKLRGGLVYIEALRQRAPDCRGVTSATRGNHGQSIGLAARRHGLAATIVVPHGNSVEKNAAMRALGVELIEHGDDFQAAREHAIQLAGAHGLHMVPSFHDDLVRGVATYWLEFFDAVQPDVVFVPIGQGSGICACAAAREHLGLHTRIIGVVSAHATAYRDSFQAGRLIEAPVSTVLADGMACRVPDPQALEVIRREVDDVIAVTDDEVAITMRALFADTHNVAEGAGAASLAGALQQRTRW